MVDVPRQIGLEPAEAHRDPPVGGRPQVMDRRPQVSDVLAAGPAELLEPLGDRLGHHHVGAAHGEPRLEGAPPRRPGPERDHRVARTHRPSGCFGDGRRPDAEARDGRALVDANATREQGVAEPPREAGRLEVGGVAHEQPLAEHRGPDPRLDLLGGQLPVLVADPESFGRLQRPSPAAGVRGCGGDGEVAGHPEPGVDALGLAPRADLAGRTPHVHQQFERVRFAVGVDQVDDVSPPAVAEAAVAPARPAAADVLFEQHDVEPRIAFPQEPSGPHAGVAAPEDHDVGGRVGGQRRSLGSGELLAGERLAQPPAAAEIGGRLVAIACRGASYRVGSEPLLLP